jgi:hypothetical protein
VWLGDMDVQQTKSRSGGTALLTGAIVRFERADFCYQRTL